MPDIRLTFKGQDFVIPDSRAFELGLEVEEIVTLSQISTLLMNPKFHKIAQCFGLMLRFAGCKVSDREVLQEMLSKAKEGVPGAGRAAAIDALAMIATVIMDGAPADGEERAPEKTEAS